MRHGPLVTINRDDPVTLSSERKPHCATEGATFSNRRQSGLRSALNVVQRPHLLKTLKIYVDYKLCVCVSVEIDPHHMFVSLFVRDVEAKLGLHQEIASSATGWLHQPANNVATTVIHHRPFRRYQSNVKLW
ncbi:hypothetical protein TNCV_80631 [Trichonephila clavipes]|nr:hypothetical protein TNCV_80631 [Trichonephila clavipes]